MQKLNEQKESSLKLYIKKLGSVCASSSRWSLSLISRPGGHSHWLQTRWSLSLLLISKPDGHFHFQTSLSFPLISRPSGHFHFHWFPDLMVAVTDFQTIYWDSNFHWFLDQMITFTFTDFQTRWSLTHSTCPTIFHCLFFLSFFSYLQTSLVPQIPLNDHQQQKFSSAVLD